MKKKNAGFGWFLLVIGFVWLLANVGVITWSVFASLRILWPLIIIVAGINIIFRDRTVKVITWLLLLAVVIVYGYFYEGKPDRFGDTAGEITTIEMEDEISRAVLDIGLGAINMGISPGAVNLIEADIGIPGVIQNYKSEGNKAFIKFSKHNYVIFKNYKSSKAVFSLNKDVIWDLDIKTGAVKADMDLTDLKVEKVEIKGGAGDIDLKLGGRHRETNVVIKGAAMDVTIEVPRNAGVKIDRSGLAFSIDTENGWEKSGMRMQTHGYDEADVKINIDVTLVAGKLKVRTG
jgi:hypothetical protein